MMEIIQVADAVAREKMIDREIVIAAIEEAIQKAGRSKFGFDRDIRAQIDRKTGDVSMSRYREVVEEIEEELENQQLTLTEAIKIKPDAKIGDFLIDELPPMDFGRIASQTAKQVIMQKIREAERQRQLEEYQGRVGEIINGTVKRIEYGNVTVDLGRAEALMRRDETIQREHFNVGDRVRAVIYDVREEQRGPQIFVSRSHPDFMAGLFAQEVPEIYDGIIEIRNVARDPGSRAKITVYTTDGSIDPVGACVGMRGSRVQAVVNELGGEKIDIIPWTDDIVSLTVSALSPSTVSKVVIDEDSHRLDVVVAEDQLSLAIGRRGQNVRLASMLTGWDIDIMTDEEESTRRTEEFTTRSNLFMQALDVDDVIAHLLVAEGFAKVEELAEASLDELSVIEGFDEDVASELQGRATAFIENRSQELQDKQKDLGLSDDLVNFEGLNSTQIIKLGENDVKTLDDLADLAGDELQEILGVDVITGKDANAIIMKAREHWFTEEDAAAETEAESNAKKSDDTKEESSAA